MCCIRVDFERSPWVEGMRVLDVRSGRRVRDVAWKEGRKKGVFICGWGARGMGGYMGRYWEGHVMGVEPVVVVMMMMKVHAGMRSW